MADEAPELSVEALGAKARLVGQGWIDRAVLVVLIAALVTATYQLRDMATILRALPTSAEASAQHQTMATSIGNAFADSLNDTMVVMTLTPEQRTRVRDRLAVSPRMHRALQEAGIR